MESKCLRRNINLGNYKLIVIVIIKKKFIKSSLIMLDLEILELVELFFWDIKVFVYVIWFFGRDCFLETLSIDEEIK